MRNIDPENISNDEWNELGYGEKLLFRGSVWIDDQEHRLATQEAEAAAQGVEYKPSVYDRFINFVVENAQGPQAG